MALFRNPRATSQSATQPNRLPKYITPVKSGPTVTAIDVVNGLFTLQDKLNQSRRNIIRAPGTPRFIAPHAGLPVSGWSGLVPFVRTAAGKIMTPY